VICLWLFGLRDVIRLVRTFDKELPSTQRIWNKQPAQSANRKGAKYHVGSDDREVC